MVGKTGNSLDLAKKYKIKTVAFPAVSTGAYGCPKEEAVQIIFIYTNRNLHKFEAGKRILAIARNSRS